MVEHKTAYDALPVLDIRSHETLHRLAALVTTRHTTPGRGFLCVHSEVSGDVAIVLENSIQVLIFVGAVLFRALLTWYPDIATAIIPKELKGGR